MVKPKISILFVHYAATQELYQCIESLKRVTLPHEIIVVDNHQDIKVKQELNRRFPSVKYIRSPGDIGFGAGNNMGAPHAQGDYIFILNEDTIVHPQAIEKLSAYLDVHQDVAISAPMLIDQSNRRYPHVGTMGLNPLTAIMSNSIIHSLWPRNPVAKKYWVHTKDLIQPKEVETIPGTAFMIRSEVFKKVGGFDENFFLYYEEFDLCKRIRALGHKIVLIPEAEVMHYWGVSTAKTPGIRQIFNQSRRYYFQKHYGKLAMILVEIISSIDKYILSLIGVVGIGAVLRLFLLNSLMMFIGDQAWFYLSARDALLQGTFPVTGITSSVTWLHQGPLYTYFLIPSLAISGFHPVAPAVITSFLGIVTIVLTYLVARLWNNKFTSVITASIAALSPLAIIHARMPYHTSVIPFFFATFILLVARKKYFLAFLFLGFLYQLELASIIIWPPMLFYLVWQRYHPRFRDALAFALGILPLIIAGPVQTAGVFIWTLYRLFIQGGQQSNTQLYIDLISRSFLPYFPVASLSFLLVAILFSIFRFHKWHVWFYFPFVAMGINRTGSEAYFTILLVPLFLILGKFLAYFPKRFVVSFLIFMAVVNSYYLISQNYLLKEDVYGPPLSERIHVSKKILSQTAYPNLTIRMTGVGSEFDSADDPYQYLLWWLSRETSDRGKHTRIEINGYNQSYRMIE